MTKNSATSQEQPSDPAPCFLPGSDNSGMRSTQWRNQNLRSRQSHQRTKAALASAAEKSEVSLSAAPSETEELSWVGLLEANAQHEEEKEDKHRHEPLANDVIEKFRLRL